VKKEQFSNRQIGIIGEEEFRHYAVLIPMVDVAGETYLVFEKRANKLKRQPGEICFPGGKLEVNETLQECAVRETAEELLIRQQQIEVLGAGDIYISPFNLMIHPFIGVLHEYQDTFSNNEVEEIIKIPLDFFRNHTPERYESKLSHEPLEGFPYDWIPGGKKYPWAKGIYDIYFYRYEECIIWGMTAHIVKCVVKLIEDYELG